MKKKILFGIIFIGVLGSICFFRALEVQSDEAGDTVPLSVMDNWEIYFKNTLDEKSNTVVCENVMELRKMDLEEGTRVETLGYNKKNDGGSGVYVVKKSNGQKDNGGTVLKLNNGLYAELILENNTVSIKQFGAHGDGKTDDTLNLNSAMNSGVSNIVFDSGEYKVTDYLLLDTDNVNIEGNGANIITDNDYRKGQKSFEWLFNIKADQISIANLNIVAKETSEVGYTTQLMIEDSKNVTINKCSFIIGDCVPQKGYCNVDLYTGWENIVIKECEMQLKADGNYGTCIMARDLMGRKGRGLEFINNTCYKIAHDEIFFLTGEGGEVTDVKIDGNRFVMDEKQAPSSEVCFSLGTSDAVKTENVTFTNNRITCKGSYVFMTFGNSKNVHVSKNEIQYQHTKELEGSLMFGGTEENSDIVIEDNTIMLSENADNTISGFANVKAEWKDNQISINEKISGAVFSTWSENVENNKVICNKAIGMIGNNLKKCTNNTFDISKGIVQSFFQYYDYELQNDVCINKNKVNYYNAEKKDNLLLLMMNKVMIGNHNVEFAENTFDFSESGITTLKYYLEFLDGSEKKIVFYKNTFDQCELVPLSQNNLYQIILKE